MPGTRTTQNVGPVLGSCYPVDVALVADEVNLWERNAKLIVYKRTQGQGKFEAVISDDTSTIGSKVELRWDCWK